jgi:hypothetical protein
MAFMEALPAIEEAAGGGEAASSSGGGRLANLFKGTKDGQGKQSQQESAPESDPMSVIAQASQSGQLNG